MKRSVDCPYSINHRHGTPTIDGGEVRRLVREAVERLHLLAKPGIQTSRRCQVCQVLWPIVWSATRVRARRCWRGSVRFRKRQHFGLSVADPAGNGLLFYTATSPCPPHGRPVGVQGSHDLDGMRNSAGCYSNGLPHQPTANRFSTISATSGSRFTQITAPAGWW
jgi:hypothetical protein